ncbi:MAG TPA: long-chain fatty acid--CoA ligase [Actinomycetota bacterium]|nr:long-chain fatty acid--CoA ligase [Actinomycetota bacterium]
MAQTIVERFWERVQSTPDKVAMRHKRAGGLGTIPAEGGEWKDITWRQYGLEVRRVGKALLAQGVGHSDKMSLLSGNRPEWHIADIGCLSIGAATAPIYITNSPDQVRHVISDSDSKVAVVENSDQLDKVLKVRGELKKLKKVVVIEGYDGSADKDFVMSWDDFLEAGDAITDDAYDDAVAAVEPKDLATFVYTSGTTGNPKGVMLTHANVWWTATHSDQHIPLGDTANGRALSYLPLSHIAERMISHFLQIFYGTTTWFAGGLETLIPDLQACKPTYFFGVPRVWEKFYAGVQAKMAAADPNDRKAKLAKKAITLGRQITEAEQAAVAAGGKMADAKVSLSVKAQHAALDKVVLHKIRAAFGLEECDLALSAAAPLAPDLIWFFHSIGIKIAEGYGQSEDNGPTSWNPKDAIKIGTVGTKYPDLEVKIADDGEILVRGGNVMAGYYKDAQATKETIDEDGWLHSGDVGEFDEHGYLKITDRKKDLIITAGGKNIAPQEIENKIKSSHALISQAVVIGDRRPFLTAIITLDEEKAPAWAKEQGIEGGMAEIANHERTLKEIEGAINEVNSNLAKVEGVKKFRVLERDFLQEENEITPTMKVKRKSINELYGDTIEAMYDKSSPSNAGAPAPIRK